MNVTLLHHDCYSLPPGPLPLHHRHLLLPRPILPGRALRRRLPQDLLLSSRGGRRLDATGTLVCSCLLLSALVCRKTFFYRAVADVGWMQLVRTKL
jgi:hypothetical protein